MNRSYSRLIVAAAVTFALVSDLGAEEPRYRIDLAVSRSSIDDTPFHDDYWSRWTESDAAVQLTNASVSIPLGRVAGYLAWEGEPEFGFDGYYWFHSGGGSTHSSSNFDAYEAGVTLPYASRGLSLHPSLALTHLQQTTESHTSGYDFIVGPTIDEVASVEQRLWGLAAAVRSDQRLYRALSLSATLLVRWGTGTVESASSGTYAEYDPDLGTVVHRERTAHHSDQGSLTMYGLNLGAQVDLGRSLRMQIGWRLRDWGDSGQIDGLYLGVAAEL